MEDALKLVDTYLEEGRPQEQKVFISDVKLRYEELRQITLHGVEVPIVRGIDRVLIKTALMIRSLEGINYDPYDDFLAKYFNSKSLRRDMYIKHKAPISGQLQKTMRDIKKGFGESKKGMAEYIKKTKELHAYMKDNKEIFDAIETKWFNIFGGPRAALKKKQETSGFYSQDYMKAMKLPDMKVAVVFSAGRYIMGVDEDPVHDIVELFMAPRTFIYALTGW